MPININIGGNVETLIVNGNPVQKVLANGVEVWSATPPAPTYPPYLTFSSPAAFTIQQIMNVVAWDGAIEYSTDTNTWTTWDGSEVSAAISAGTYYIYFRGTGNTTICNASGEENIWYIDAAAGVSCSGDIRVLLDYADPENVSPVQSCFFCLFKENDKLVSAPDILLNTLPVNCCSSMFLGCTALTIPPKIAATTFENNACNQMFRGCSALETLPRIYATTIKVQSCLSMFNGCSLIKMSETQTGEYQTPYCIPAEGTGTAGTYAFSNMFLNTGGTFKNNPTVNTTYYTSNAVIG